MQCKLLKRKYILCHLLSHSTVGVEYVRLRMYPQRRHDLKFLDACQFDFFEIRHLEVRFVRLKRYLSAVFFCLTRYFLVLYFSVVIHNRIHQNRIHRHQGFLPNRIHQNRIHRHQRFLPRKHPWHAWDHTVVL